MKSYWQRAYFSTLNVQTQLLVCCVVAIDSGNYYTNQIRGFCNFVTGKFVCLLSVHVTLTVMDGRKVTRLGLF